MFSASTVDLAIWSCGCIICGACCGRRSPIKAGWLGGVWGSHGGVLSAGASEGGSSIPPTPFSLEAGSFFFQLGILLDNGSNTSLLNPTNTPSVEEAEAKDSKIAKLKSLR